MNHRTHAPQKSLIAHRTATAGERKGLGIVEVTARAGVSERLVRHCEARSLISGPEKADSSSGQYTYEDVCVLRFARRAHVLGFGMNEVATLLSLWRNKSRTGSNVQSIASAHPEEMESGIDELQATECVLQRLANLISVEHQPACPIVEELMELKLRKLNSELDKRVKLRTALFLPPMTTLPKSTPVPTLQTPPEFAARYAVRGE